MNLSVLKYAMVSALLLALSGPTMARAGGEHIWELAGHDEFARGELLQTMLSDKGEIRPGLANEKIDIDAVGLIWSVVKAEDGTLYLGTAYDGKIYRVDGNRAHLIATTDSLVVTDMLIDSKGTLLASTIPGSTVWRISHPEKIDVEVPVKATPHVTLAAEEMIWTIALDAKTQTLYMGTGPEGKIWSAGKDGKPHLLLDTEEKHILDILPTEDGILAGTSPGALLLKVTAPGVSFALADFDGTEVKSIAALSANQLAVAVNEFVHPRTTPGSASKAPKQPASAMDASARASTSPSTKTSSKDHSFVYLVDATGAFEQVLEQKGTHITEIAVAENNTIFAALGNEGKIVSIARDRSVSEVADLAEREVMCVLADSTLSFAATGDAGAAYRFSDTHIQPVYLTPVLDSKAVSHFGKLSWMASGPLRVKGRSGNTITPTDNWTDWSAPIKRGTAPSLAPGRYVQFRIEWLDATTSLMQFELFYTPGNRRAVITHFTPDTPFADTRGASTGEAGTSERTVRLRPSGTNSKDLSLNWSVDNPDKDKLRYRLYYKPVGVSLWLPIFKDEEPFTGTYYSFKTDTVPEGLYHFKLIADDSIENPAGSVLTDEMISVPVPIDNHPPTISELKVDTATNRVSGKASDSWSPIAALDYAVDGGNWMPVAASDGMLDAPTESFSFAIVPALSRGGHVVAVRAMDRNGNYTVRERHVEVSQ